MLISLTLFILIFVAEWARSVYTKKHISNLSFINGSEFYDLSDKAVKHYMATIVNYLPLLVFMSFVSYNAFEYLGYSTLFVSVPCVISVGINLTVGYFQLLSPTFYLDRATKMLKVSGAFLILAIIMLIVSPFFL